MTRKQNAMTDRKYKKVVVQRDYSALQKIELRERALAYAQEEYWTQPNIVRLSQLILKEIS